VIEGINRNTKIMDTKNKNVIASTLRNERKEEKKGLL
jgi:hypothetical protein